MKTHVIFGAGLIGCFLGGVMTANKLNVSLVCRSHIKKKLSKGLLLTDYQQHRSDISKIEIIDAGKLNDRDNQPEHCDFLWLTVKCTGVAQAAEDISPFVGQNTVIFCCQNGLGSDQQIKHRYPDNLVLRVMVPFNVAEPEAGHLHRGSEGVLTIENATDKPSLVPFVVAQINHPLMPSSATDEMQAMLWAKLQLNLGNSINALADIPVKQMLEQRPYRLVIAAMMRELLAVTTAQNMRLPKVAALPGKMLPIVLSLPNLLFKLLANKMLAIDPTVRTSMWWDLSQAKQTEIDHLNGAILKAAEKLNVQCTANQRVIDLVKKQEKSMRETGERQPISADALLKLVSE